MRTLTGMMALVFLWACQNPDAENRFRLEMFISMDSLMQEQSQCLDGKLVHKTVTIGSSGESVTKKINQGFLDKEWSFLDEFELNKPGFSGGIETTKNDTLVRYTPKAGQHYLIDYLDFYFDQERRLTQISGSFTDNQSRFVYASAREFDMELEEGCLVRYHIRGYQKIIFKDTVFFEVKGIVGRE